MSFQMHCVSQNVFDFGQYRGQVDEALLEWVLNIPESHQPVADGLTKRRKIKWQQPRNRAVPDVLYDLKFCARKRDLQKGRGVHTSAMQAGIDSNMHVAAALINMYAKCGSMVEARTVFDSIQEPDVVCWSALILGYADCGEGLVALDMFSRMKDEKRCAANSVTYISAIKACTSLAADGDEAGRRWCLERGREIHFQIGCHMNHFMQNTLIDMYAKCGSMVEARRVFDSMEEPDVASWNTLILGYANNGQGLLALDLFSRMKGEGKCTPSSVTYVAALKANTSLASSADIVEKGRYLERGKQIHREIGNYMDHLLQNTLIDMYAKCGSMLDARRVFESIQNPDVVSWNTLILGYAENGQGLVALDLFLRMKDERNCAANSVTYVAVLKACMSMAAEGDEAGKRSCLEWGQRIHLEIGRHMDPFVASTLIGMYAKCCIMEQARRVFDNIQDPNVVSWTALIQGYVENGQGRIALDLFFRMKHESICTPNSRTYVAAIKACTSLAADGDEVERRCCLEWGREMHLDLGPHMGCFLQSALIDMYSKCGSMGEARKLFGSIQRPEVASWNVLIMGYVENGQGLVALDLFSRMKEELTPNSVTYVAALKACSSIGALATGRKIHAEIRMFNAHVVTSLVDLYAKCGSMGEALQVFNLHSRVRDVSTWNALIAGYSRLADSVSVFKLFDAMQDLGFRPDAVTFLCMLSCCSHAGLLDKASELLELMPVHYGVTHTLKHYNCLIDLLTRANKLDDAVTLLQKLPCDPNAVTWTTLLGACRKRKNAEVGRLAFESLMNLDQKNPTAYVLMAEIYGSRGMWEEQKRVLLDSRMIELGYVNY